MLLRLFSVDEHPIRLTGLALIALPNTAEKREVALVSIAIVGLPLGGGFRSNVDVDGEIGDRQVALNFFEPRRVEALRLAVGDARRTVAIADQDVADGQPFRDRRRVFVRRLRV